MHFSQKYFRLQEICQCRHRHKARDSEYGDHAQGKRVQTYVEAGFSAQTVKYHNGENTYQTVCDQSQKNRRFFRGYGAYGNRKDGNAHHNIQRIHIRNNTAAIFSGDFSAFSVFLNICYLTKTCLLYYNRYVSDLCLLCKKRVPYSRHS